MVLLLFFSFEGIGLEIFQVTISEVQYRDASKKLAALLADPDVEVSTPTNHLIIYIFCFMCEQFVVSPII